MEETNRQKKIAGVLQNDLATVMQKWIKDSGQAGVIVSVTKVHVTADLGLAKVYVSVFPSDKGTELVKELNEMQPRIKHHIAQLTRNQFRKMPDLAFFNDDSLDYIDQIERAFEGDDDPIRNPDLLPKRKKK